MLTGKEAKEVERLRIIFSEELADTTKEVPLYTQVLERDPIEFAIQNSVNGDYRLMGMGGNNRWPNDIETIYEPLGVSCKKNPEIDLMNMGCALPPYFSTWMKLIFAYNLTMISTRSFPNEYGCSFKLNDIDENEKNKEASKLIEELQIEIKKRTR